MKKRILLILWLIHGTAQAADLPGIPAFIDEMVTKNQFKREEMQLVFKRAEYRSDVIDSITKPAILKPWVEYRPYFVNQQRIDGGVQFAKKYSAALKRAEQKYGVPQEIIIGILGVETIYGRNTGHYLALDSLTTLAFDYPRRAEFFRAELEQYLLLAREQGFDLLGIQSSYAGALGIPQFMPSSYRRYAVDHNGNGRIDLINEPEDAIGSVANYLKQYGWQRDEPVALQSKVQDEKRLGTVGDVRPYIAWLDAGVAPLKKPEGDMPPAWLLDFTVESGKEYWLVFNNFNVIMRYNNSNYYAMTVYQLADAIRREKGFVALEGKQVSRVTGQVGL
jgi:membrane-bound lytic murein transglycosylase B